MWRAPLCVPLSQQLLQKDPLQNPKTTTMTPGVVGTVPFTADGSISKPQMYRIKAIYADEATQVLLPCVHDFFWGGETWVLGAGYPCSIDPSDPGQNQTFVQIANSGDLKGGGYTGFF
jgi:hypothetical protein